MPIQLYFKDGLVLSYEVVWNMNDEDRELIFKTHGNCRAVCDEECRNNMTTLDQAVEESYGNSKGHGFHDLPEVFSKLDALIQSFEDALPATIDSTDIHDLKTLRQEFLKAYNTDVFNTKLVLIHSEVSEALEEYRAGKPALYYVQDKHDKAKPEGWGVELIDAVIRIADLLGMTGQSLQELYDIKKKYNAGREYKHGKAY